MCKYISPDGTLRKCFVQQSNILDYKVVVQEKWKTQESHIAVVFLAYALLQYDRRKTKLKTPEEILRTAEHKKGTFLKRYIQRLEGFIHHNFI
jgi:hypothetical protein